MLKALRENTKTILWITIISFVALIFLAWGMDIQSGKNPDAGTAAKIGGYAISRRQLEDNVRGMLQNYRRQYDQPPTDAQTEAIREQAWNDLVQNILLNQEASRRGLEATDEEVVFTIRMDPPPIVQYAEEFQTDGRFDVQKYRARLQDPTLDWTTLENYVRSSLPTNKLQYLVAWGVKVSEPEIRQIYNMNNETRTVSYVFVDPARMEIDESAITEKQARDYYKNNKERFTEPEKARLAYLFLELKPSPADSAEVVGDLNRILEEIRGGEDFEEMARIYSEGPAADDGGNPGRVFKKGELNRAMEDVLFSMEEGEVSEPFLDPQGYHLVKLVEKTAVDETEQVDFRNILKTVSPGQPTVDLLLEKVQGVESLIVEDMSLKEAALANGLEVSETPFFTKETLIPGLSGLPRANEQAFSMSVGEVRGPVSNYSGHYFIELLDRQKERLKSFEEVRDECFAALRDERLADAAFAEAQSIAAAAAGVDSLEGVAMAESLEVKTAGPFNRSGYVVGVGREPRFAGAAFADSVGAPPVAVKGTRGSYVIRVDAVKEPDPEGFEENKASLIQSLRQQKQNRAYNQWLAELKEEADIKDFRDKY
jgi:peptidylprolyl isomerase/peptidyl-prolyl cis-trans isomerase D